ncbi:hypothetical protein [Epibacterium ulvae]|uniref:hypothetical protein n=1 Tax=Epibacterium ulvae TaxID=1156985 RepID=UPI0024925181|nr:hypothetical protein [Epibacterium ulvae]
MSCNTPLWKKGPNNDQTTAKAMAQVSQQQSPAFKANTSQWTQTAKNNYYGNGGK